MLSERRRILQRDWLECYGTPVWLVESFIDPTRFDGASWFEADYKQRREECQVPEDLTFKTKPQLATEILTDVTASGLFPARPANDGFG